MSKADLRLLAIVYSINVPVVKLPAGTAKGLKHFNVTKGTKHVGKTTYGRGARRNWQP